MAAKTFGGKKIAIRRITTADLKHAKKFQVFINALIREEAKILMAKEVTLKEEKEFLKKVLAGAKERTKIYFAAECDGEIVATTSIELDRLRKNHIGKFGIVIKQGYRGIGLGTYLMSEIIKAAKKELRPTPKMIQLDVYTDNKPAIGLYKKMGFRRVARIPKQVQYKGKLVDEFVMQLYLK
jgi:ribosomal protein S18 acetylase RimI-like enzyme